MADPAQQQTSHGEVDHGLEDVDALFVVAHQAAPTGEPTEGAFDDPAPGQDLEARFVVDAANHLDDEVDEAALSMSWVPAPEFVRHGYGPLAVDLAAERRCTGVERLGTLMSRPHNLLKLLIESVYRRQKGVISRKRRHLGGRNLRSCRSVWPARSSMSGPER